ncbi:ABC transporter substrate-binding protein [Natrinema salifodinae]|uniref:Thiamine pyrimidine synthase n=1 Tax=Natrinema salifodinae TaxID=1202768 RepID=A0A1I0QSZ5_9EURY|nr:ABC transporter substrate-binding protein [Natrinema salifodinae]SEW30517.1 NitT/TauT family transport system substrate-binding protein [Natrinema salifodinae]
MSYSHPSRRAILAVGGGIAVSGCIGSIGSDSPGAGTDDVTLLLNWNLSGLHAPYVAARENGFYDEAGFTNVELESGDGSDFAANQAGLGNVEFAITSSDQLLAANANELSPIAVGIVMQRNPNVVFADRERFGELAEPAQLEGATIGSGPGMVRTMTEAYLAHHGVLDGVDYVDTGFDTIQQLLTGDIDVAGGVFGDVVDAEQQGGEIETLEVHDVVPSYGHLIATNEAFAEENPDTVRSFLRATARGAVWAARNPDQAIDLLVDSQPELDETRANQYEKWAAMHAGYMRSETVETDGWGTSDSGPWTETYETLAAADFFEGEVDPADVWTNEYLDSDSEYIADYADLTGE